MLLRFRRHASVVLCTLLLVGVGVRLPSRPGSALLAQSAVVGKKALSYDAYDAWWSIQGTTLSRDGEWLAYGLTSQGLDGQLVVRNLRTGQELKHPRGTNPAFTPDGKVVTFTIAQTKAEEEKERLSGRGRAGEGAAGRGAEGAAGRGGANAAPRTSAGIMTLATGQVTTVERVGGVSLPEESSSWAAMHRGRAGGGGRGGRGGGRGGRGGAEPPAATPPQAPAAAAGAPSEAIADGATARQAQGQRQRFDRPQPRHRAGHHDSARQRLRVVERWILARLRGLVREGRGGRRVRPQDERRHDRPAPQGQGQLQEPRVRRRGRAARLPQRPGRVRQGRLAVPGLLLESR